ncbi:conserved hypothetical protein [Rippkaea orientalis PCC 8801]|uniref:DUF3134 domain-containing protein n=1 Tax=Rippkaea orientalis (strain PCC 8801 / RF-1) TaxID=41431 RepID=B7JVF5_RIPO1|nr:DUF3134 domain-containing protein [Rippkaea orientalis]ACK68288.1 conserved hypothetical protein [Rippkaea orientalis PCC 8801]
MSNPSYNPSLRQEPRYEPAAVIPVKHDFALLDWLESTNRLISREIEESSHLLSEDEEISELMDVDDTYDDDDDDDIDLDED